MSTREATRTRHRSTHTVSIIVNNQRVKVDSRRPSGLAIKRAAIRQGVTIDLDFQLAMVRPDGRQQIIGDNDRVDVNDESRFVATASDDNS